MIRTAKEKKYIWVAFSTLAHVDSIAMRCSKVTFRGRELFKAISISSIENMKSSMPLLDKDKVPECTPKYSTRRLRTQYIGSS
jgi:hypothetical protein